MYQEQVSTFLLVAVILAFVLFIFLLVSTSTNQTVRTLSYSDTMAIADSKELVKDALIFHGIHTCRVDSVGFYFIRNGQRCEVFTPDFAEWHIERN